MDGIFAVADEILVGLSQDLGRPSGPGGVGLDELSLVDSEEQLRRLYEAARDGILFVDRDRGVILDANPYLLDLLDYSREEVVGKHLWEIGLLGDEGASRTAFRELQDRGFVRHDNLPLESRNGRRVEVEFASNVYRTGDHLVIQCNIRDISARRQADAQLKRALEAAEESGRVKDLFLSALSHELRTPLTPILAAAACLESALDLPERLRPEAALIRRNVETESRLIDDLLEMTRIGRGKLELHHEVLDAHDAIRAALDLCRVDVDSKRLEVTVAMRADSHLIWGDSIRLQQVFWNLIKNAAKFTPVGGSLRICTSDSDGRLAIDFSDTGEGIEPSFLPRIFDLFEQGNPASSRRHGGLGLGLAIAKMVVDLHGGTLIAESEGVGLGSTFRVLLEQVSGVTATPDRPLTVPPRAGVPENTPLKLLLVDDNLDTLRTIGQLLRTMGFTVRPASCVREALESMASERPDLLISDIGLPDGSGLEIMQQARDVYGVKGIAFSGYSSREDVEESIGAGFSHHLAKPSSLNDLVRLIRETVV